MRSFNRFCLVTLIAVYVLILVGGVVRSSGSGMGCPDWPKCFGSWVPPTSVDQLPENYKEEYAAYRHKKNIRFASFLSSIGFGETARKILEDESILVEADFNATKTWIEYFNRIVGVIIGILIIATFVSSIRLWKHDRAITVMAFVTLVMVIIQGWFGSIVVSTNLTPWTITLHMFLAMVIVFFLVFMLHRSDETAPVVSSPLVKVLLVMCIILLMIQIMLGTQVREAIDRVAAMARHTWIANAGVDFIIHRSFSWVVLALHALLFVKLIKRTEVRFFAYGMGALVAGAILTGVGLAYLAVPPVLQPTHLLLATAAFGIQVYLFFRMKSNVNASTAG